MTEDNDRSDELADAVHLGGSDFRGRRTVPVTLQRSASRDTSDQGLWIAIRNRTQAISFDRYSRFVDRFLSDEPPTERPSKRASASSSRRPLARIDAAGRSQMMGTDGYNLLRLATEAFLLFEAGLVFNEDELPESRLRPEPLEPDPLQEADRLGGDVSRRELTARLNEYFAGKVTLPYLNRIIFALTGIEPEAETEAGLDRFGRVLEARLSNPSMIELIWSYWHEEGMLVQSMNAIALRFQNRRAGGARDPLANLELDTLRPLNTILWGYIQAAYTRLTVPRRAYEYDHHYGLALVGKAVPTLRSADSRSKFLEAYHNLLYRASVFYREDADTTVIADAFPLLNALRELHMILAEGAHNQFGDLPWTARAEMMVEQWLLARPEMRDFLHGRAAVPYQEPWIGTVDAMTRLQGWSDTGATQFHELAVTGEQIILTVRYHDWSDLNFTQDQAKNWARYWKNELQRYMHAYQAVTGVDLTSEPVDTRAGTDRYLQPSTLLRNRVEARRSEGALSGAVSSGYLSDEGERYVAVPASTSRSIAMRRKP